MTVNPKIFISYSWSSKDHVEWVINLAKKLRADGIDVIIDRWDLKPGQDKYHFMEQMVKDKEVKKVLMICDKLYAEKANERKAEAGTETQIISKEVYSEVSQEKFIPVVTEKDINNQPYLPIFLISRIYIDLSNPESYYENYEELLRNIYEKPLYAKPKLGEAPSFIVNDDFVPLKTTHRLQSFKDALLQNRGYSLGYAEDFLKSFQETFVDIKISREDTTEPLDELVYKSIKSFCPYRDEYLEFLTLICKYSKEDEYKNYIHNFFSNMLPYVWTELAENPLYDNFEFIIYELFLYTIAILLKYERFHYVNFLLMTPYFFRDNRNSFKTDRNLVSFTKFCPYCKTIEEDRKRRLNNHSYNVTSSIVAEFINPKLIELIDLVDADYILYLRSNLDQTLDEYTYHNWYPYNLVSARHTYSLPIFIKGVSKEYFKNIALILGVNNKENLLKIIEQKCNENSFSEINYLGSKPCEHHKRLMNLEKLNTV